MFFESIAIGSIKTLLDIIILVKDKLIPTRRGHGFNFERVIEPIFTSLQPVVDDYFMFFRRALTALQSAATDHDINDIVFGLQADREKMLTTRITIRAAAQELIEKAGTDQYTKFFTTV
jgi:hypothetical protein